MSGIFGIFNRNGKAIDKKMAKDMMKVMSRWDPDENALWIDGSVAFGHAMLWNTPESKYEHLPLQKDVFILTMDARIDNRDELAKEVKLPDRPMSEIGDSEFILAAYRKWGDECSKYLLGDFAFVIWDEKKRELFCARDQVGIKSLFFYLTDDEFIFSNDIETLLSVDVIPNDLDKNSLAFFIKSSLFHPKSETFFESIKKLLPATQMIISENEITKTTYWTLENSPEIRYDTFDEYVNHLKKIYNNALEVRLRSESNIVSHMSGGIDSSPIAVLASRKLRERQKPLHTFNWIDIPTDEDRYEYEAWKFSRRIAANEENIIHEEFRIDPAYKAHCIKSHNILTQGVTYFWEENYIQDEMNKMGARVMLSGWGGDELISYNGYSYIEGLFSQGNFIRALGYLIKEKKYSDYSWKQLIKRVVKIQFSHFTEKIQKLKNYKNRKTSSPNTENNEYKYYKNKYSSFLKKHKDIRMNRGKGVRNNQLSMYNFGHLQHRIESWALMGLSKKIEYRYPLLDKRIIEFTVGIPEEMFFPIKGKERPLIKKAISHLLPADIVWFNKPNETKINQSLLVDCRDVLKIICADMDSIDENAYIDYRKLKDDCDKLNFDTIEREKIQEIVPALLAIYSFKNINV